MLSVFALPLLLFLAAELALLIKAGGTIGVMPTLGLLVLAGMGGVALAKNFGLPRLRRLQPRAEVDQTLVNPNALNQSPPSQNLLNQNLGRDLVDSVLVLLASVLLVFPGLLSDGLGLLLLLKPFRALVRRGTGAFVMRRIRLMKRFTHLRLDR